jgi:Zn-dependent peptidase ImmA (M78 family)
MPEKEIRPLLHNLSLPRLAELKIYWKASMQAIIKRASDLNIITDRQSRSLWSKMSANGYRIHEPLEDEIPQEIPTLYNEIIEVYRDELNYSLPEFSKLLNMFDSETKNIYCKNRGHGKFCVNKC